MTTAVHQRRLRGPTRKAFLVVHIVSAGAWIGIDLVLGVLVFTALFTHDPQTAATSYQVLELFAVGPLLIVGLVCLASGVVLGLGSKYGLVRYRWVATKLVLTVVLLLLVLFALRPDLNEAADHGRQLVSGNATTAAIDDLVFPPVVSMIALLVTVLLSVYKPWGRVDRRRSRHTNPELSQL